MYIATWLFLFACMHLGNSSFPTRTCLGKVKLFDQSRRNSVMIGIFLFTGRVRESCFVGHALFIPVCSCQLHIYTALSLHGSQTVLAQSSWLNRYGSLVPTQLPKLNWPGSIVWAQFSKVVFFRVWANFSGSYVRVQMSGLSCLWSIVRALLKRSVVWAQL